MFFTCPTWCLLNPWLSTTPFPCTPVQGWVSWGPPAAPWAPGTAELALVGAQSGSWARQCYTGPSTASAPFGGWHVCDCDGCPAMPGRDWLGWGLWCQCPGEAGASLTDPMPVSCSAEPICAHLGHSSPLTASTSCSPSPVPEPATQGLTAHLEPSILTVWPLCLCISRLLGGANMLQVGRAPVRSSGSGISGAVTHELPGHGLRRCLCQKTGDFNAIRCHLILHNSCCLIH